MHILDYIDKNISVDEFITLINDTRKANKNQWYGFGGNVEGRKVLVKGIGTWLQIYNIEGLNLPTAMEIPVKQFLAELRRPFNG